MEPSTHHFFPLTHTINEVPIERDISCYLMFMYTYNNLLLLTTICWLFTILVWLLVALWLVSLLSIALGLCIALGLRIALGNWLVPCWLIVSLCRLAITLMLLLSILCI